MRSVAVLPVLLAITLGAACAARSGPPDSLFTQRLNGYLALRGEAAAAVGRVRSSDDAADITGDAAQLRAEIQRRREGAREGDVVGGTVGQRLSAALNARLSERDAARILARVASVQPDEERLVVNERYPAGEPRPSTPGPLLEVLPPLPRELSYRFVGRDLVLLDRSTALVVDILRNALPPAAAAAR